MENGEVKSLKFMLIKTVYPKLLHGCDFPCFNLRCMINEFEKVEACLGLYKIQDTPSNVETHSK